MPFGSRRRKKRPEISAPMNFEHRIHAGFDSRSGSYTGLPRQWQSIIGITPRVGRAVDRPKPIVDPSSITPVEMAELKMIVRGDSYRGQRPGSTIPFRTSTVEQNSPGFRQMDGVPSKGISVARSNSLRQNSPTDGQQGKKTPSALTFPVIATNSPYVDPR